MEAVTLTMIYHPGPFIAAGGDLVRARLLRLLYRPQTGPRHGKIVKSVTGKYLYVHFIFVYTRSI